MKELKIATSNDSIYYRLIAVWVFCEAFAGGIIHGLKLPVSGIIVGSCSVICISLIATYKPVKGFIIKATIIVAIFKMMLSPQSPPMAYVAVFFQGMLGELLYSNKRHFNITCLIFSVVALLESGLQRIVILTFIYGKNLWQVVDETISKLFHMQTTGSISLTVAIIYLTIHLFAGIASGIIVLQIIKKSLTWKIQLPQYIIQDDGAVSPQSITLYQPLHKKKGYPFFLVLYIFMLFLYIQSAGYLGKPFFTQPLIAGIILRASIILLSWYLLVGPLIEKLIKSWLKNKKISSQKDIEAVLFILPTVKNNIITGWKLASVNTGWQRLKLFCKIVVINTL